MRAVIRFLLGVVAVAATAGAATVVAVTPLWWAAVRVPLVYAFLLVGGSITLVLWSAARKHKKSAENRSR